MNQLGAPIHAIEGDITDLWFHELHRGMEEAASGDRRFDRARASVLPGTLGVGSRHACGFSVKNTQPAFGH